MEGGIREKLQAGAMGGIRGDLEEDGGEASICSSAEGAIIMGLRIAEFLHKGGWGDHPPEGGVRSEICYPP